MNLTSNHWLRVSLALDGHIYLAMVPPLDTYGPTPELWAPYLSRGLF